jgi:hypothetical protein
MRENLDVHKILYMVDPVIAGDYMKHLHTSAEEHEGHEGHGHDHGHVHNTFTKEPENNVERALVECL